MRKSHALIQRLQKIPQAGLSQGLIFMFPNISATSFIPVISTKEKSHAFIQRFHKIPQAACPEVTVASKLKKIIPTAHQ